MASFKYNISQEKSLKSQKIKLFQKGLTHGYGQKIAIFPTFFVGNKNQQKGLLRYPRTKKCLSRL